MTKRTFDHTLRPPNPPCPECQNRITLPPAAGCPRCLGEGRGDSIHTIAERAQFGTLTGAGFAIWDSGCRETVFESRDTADDHDMRNLDRANLTAHCVNHLPRILRLYRECQAAIEAAAAAPEGDRSRLMDETLVIRRALQAAVKAAEWVPGA